MNHEDDMKLVRNYYQCPKEKYYNQKIYGKTISRHVPKRTLRRNKDDPLLKSSCVQFPHSICEEDAFAKMGIGNNHGDNGEDDGDNVDVCNSIDNKNKNMKKLDAITKFGLYFLRNVFKNSTFIAHNR